MTILSLSAFSASARTMANNPSSSITAIPSSLASFILRRPQRMPTSNYVVASLTGAYVSRVGRLPEETSPPCRLMKASASSLAMESITPLIVKVTPDKQSKGPAGAVLPLLGRAPCETASAPSLCV
eukprot:CAMPEP_0119211620 /NCGR_PEP_ID=MMETSP1327-20130426/3066_1 /TAXON_ID=38833 /ORGANISM="Micromonas pusilla, Strain RCC2306" /LENGTH=125 /DNA_ID=CAMNT_0007208763 /DNA_START=1831 /DNA_END=2208 /DNA_ORIENTATION=-